ncbi:MAG: DUF4215 domain-containing protein [bacterium]
MACSSVFLRNGWGRKGWGWIGGGGIGLLVGFVLSGSGCAAGVSADAAICGDGVLAGEEECDDGNPDSGDGCGKNCIVETGYTCDASGCSPLCGDGLIVGAEVCDGSNLAGATCEALALGSGELACDLTCALDTSGCQAVLCGNGVVDSGEECDGADMNSETCAGQGYDGGTLACTVGCLLDRTGCTLASCGNGIVEGVEACDDADLDPGDGCSSNCSIEAGWECVGQPSVCAELCGNSSLDPGEQCDGAELGGQTCAGLGQGYVGGTLSCAVNCTFNVAQCELPTCGNGLLDAGEQCDGVLLNGQTCVTVGSYIGGTLLCLPSCAYDLTNCMPVTCGDGIISAGEACDDGNQTGGDGCNILCNVEAGWTCAGEPSSCSPLCGNNQLDAGEQCDGGQLGGQTCQGLGYDIGSLACGAACTYNTAGCSMFSCGDGQITGLESCDGANLGGATCLSLGFVGGTLLCTGTCGFDTAGCIAPACGDGIISAGEQCDDNNTSSGDGCNAACQVENGWLCQGTPSTCTLSCGNGAVDPGEACDGGDLNGQTCVSQGFAGGTLSCNAGCTFNTSACQAAICGNGNIEAGEACDGANLGGQTCANFGYAGGTLACTGSCTINTSGCTNSVCGNGAVEAGEECDDGNTAGGDGCSGSCFWEHVCSADGVLTCGVPYSGNLGSADDTMYDYSCGSWASGDPENVYSFVAPSSGTASANLTCSDDFDLYILGPACRDDMCIAYSDNIGCPENPSFSVTAGQTYYIAVEAYSGSGSFTLTVTCP